MAETGKSKGAVVAPSTTCGIQRERGNIFGSLNAGLSKVCTFFLYLYIYIYIYICTDAYIHIYTHTMHALGGQKGAQALTTYHEYIRHSLEWQGGGLKSR